MENGSDVDDPFADVPVGHDVTTASKNACVRVDAPSGVLDREGGHQHLGITIADVVDESDFFIVDVNDQHAVQYVESRPAVARQFYDDFLLRLFTRGGYWRQFEFALAAEIEYDVAFVIYFQ